MHRVVLLSLAAITVSACDLEEHWYSYDLSELDVTFTESLQKKMKAEVVDGFNWDEDNKGVQIRKRWCLGKLPQTIALQANRFI